jgi:8-amino-7-oxononanoate synthase
MEQYSIKMRASQKRDGERKHISGAEIIVEQQQVKDYVQALVERGFSHAKGKADSIHFKIEKINPQNIHYLEALPVKTIEVDTWQKGQVYIKKFLKEIKVANPQKVISYMEQTYTMRGAMLLHADTLERLEPQMERGIRATYMDQERNKDGPNISKSHYEEAIVLATKVANAPGIIGEICVSDDPQYVTGYVSSLEKGYMRITKMKKMGSENGGRIFLFRGDEKTKHDCISFLENEKVIVRNIKPLKAKKEEADHLPNHSKWNIIEEELQNLKDQHLFRTMKEIESAQSSHVTYQGKDMLMLASNSYLDLSADERMKLAVIQAAKQYGVGAGGSRLTTGHTTLHRELEETLAKFKETQAALVFNTGYVTNVAVIAALATKESIIFSDELNHASIVDGCRLSKAKTVIYRHNDMDDLEKKILENPCERGLVVSDAVFSMDGDILQLPRFLTIAEKYQLFSMIDEAHSTGVIGQTGHGIIEHFQMKKKPDFIMGTLSKAIGSEGGFVCASEQSIQYLMNKARGFIFSTSLSPMVMATARQGIEIIMEEPQRVATLQDNVRFFIEALQQAGISAKSESAIIPIIIGDEEKALLISKALSEAGYFISAIRYPTVKKGCARLRITLMSSHTKEELNAAASTIGSLVRNHCSKLYLP